MPGMSGSELQHELTTRGWTVPVVFITAKHDPGVRSRVLAAGAVECVFKPSSETALLAAVNAAVFGQQSSRWRERKAAWDQFLQPNLTSSTYGATHMPGASAETETPQIQRLERKLEKRQRKVEKTREKLKEARSKPSKNGRA